MNEIELEFLEAIKYLKLKEALIFELIYPVPGSSYSEPFCHELRPPSDEIETSD